MHWHLQIEDGFKVLAEEEGYMPDPFWDLYNLSKNGGGSARVSATVQRSTDYGSLKCSFTVSIDCPQTQQHMNYAGHLAFATAVQYVNNGFSYLVPEAPKLEVPQWIPSSTS